MELASVHRGTHSGNNLFIFMSFKFLLFVTLIGRFIIVITELLYVYFFDFATI